MIETPVDVLRSVIQAVDARIAQAVGTRGLSVAEWRLLSLLHDAGAVPPSLLAGRMGLTRGGVTKLIDRLRMRRLLVRAGGGGADRRFQTIALTGAGAVLVREVMPGARDAAVLTDGERAAMAAAIA